MSKTPSLAVGVDLGGTQLKVALVDAAGSIRAKTAAPTAIEAGPEAVVADMVRLCELLLQAAGLPRTELAAVGVASPGPLDLRTGCIIRAANLPGWDHVPLRDRAAESFQLPVVLENDGNAAAYGEFRAGAGQGHDDLVALTLGTGVGAGVITAGKLLHGHFDNAGELGHTIVEPQGLPCPCGQRGCLEQYASAAAVARRVRAALEDGAAASELHGVSLADLDARGVAEAARRQDPLCVSVWEEACRYLAIACINIQHAFNPSLVLLGGGMSAAGSLLLERVRHNLALLRWTLHDDLPQVALAQLGNDAGVIGAAILARDSAAPVSPGQ